MYWPTAAHFQIGRIESEPTHSTYLFIPLYQANQSPLGQLSQALGEGQKAEEQQNFLFRWGKANDQNSNNLNALSLHQKASPILSVSL